MDDELNEQTNDKGDEANDNGRARRAKKEEGEKELNEGPN